MYSRACRPLTGPLVQRMNDLHVPEILVINSLAFPFPFPFPFPFSLSLSYFLISSFPPFPPFSLPSTPPLVPFALFWDPDRLVPIFFSDRPTLACAIAKFTLAPDAPLTPTTYLLFCVDETSTSLQST